MEDLRKVPFSPLRPPNKSFFYRQDGTLLLKSFFSVREMIGIGLAASLLLPKIAVAALVTVIFVPSVTTFFLCYFDIIAEPDKRALIRGRQAAKIEGDFVVFLIGSRPNYTNKLSQHWKVAGDAMCAIVKELEENPQLGCLGTESYVGDNADGSKTLIVQYWKSAELLGQYAASSSNNHSSPWSTYMKILKDSDEIAFWHETFQVKSGCYEAIYVNCPALHLGACRGVDIIPATGHYATMKNRLNVQNHENTSSDDNENETK